MLNFLPTLSADPASIDQSKTRKKKIDKKTRKKIEQFDVEIYMSTEMIQIEMTQSFSSLNSVADFRYVGILT